MTINTVSVHFTADQKLLDYLHKKFSKLEQFYDKIIDAQVFLKLENSGQVKDKILELRLNVPGDTLHVTETAKSFEAAADSAVDTMKRQIKKYKEKFNPRPQKS